MNVRRAVATGSGPARAVAAAGADHAGAAADALAARDTGPGHATSAVDAPAAGGTGAGHAGSAVDTLAAALRREILDGARTPGTPLREQALAGEHAAARHTVRAALRALVAEGLAIAEPNRGVRVRPLDRDGLEALGELRVALETEGARLALARHGGALPPAVHAAADRFEAACVAGPSRSRHEVVDVDRTGCGEPQPPPGHAAAAGDGRAGRGAWARVTEAHETLHHAIVAASGSARITDAHARLGAEGRLFLAALRPEYDPPALAADHRALVARIERDGPDVLRDHIADSTARLVARLGN